jgi:hypothetical protein
MIILSEHSTAWPNLLRCVKSASTNSNEEYRARICKRLSSPGIDSMDSIPPACRAGTSNRVVVPAPQAGNRFLGSLKGLQIRAQAGNETDRKRRIVERIF